MRRKITIFIILAMVLFVAMLVFLAEASRTIQNLQPSPAPSDVSVATPIVSRQGITPSLSKLQLLSVDPLPDPEGAKNYPPSLKITLRFNKEVNPNTVKILVAPAVVIRKDSGISQRELVIQPDPPHFWQPDQLYTVTIRKDTQAIDGTRLNEDITYQFQTKFQGGL